MTASDSRMIDLAAQRLAEGRLVAFPTETVYGLGGDAENPEAIRRIYDAKGRPSNHPVIVHLAPEADVGYWAAAVPEAARRLMDAFWPGPLTLILPRASHVPAAVSGGQSTVGLRCPSHPVAQQLLRRFAALKASGHAGVAAPSANKFGQVSPTQAEHVRSEFADLGEDRLFILEGGAAEVGIESTIVDLSRLDQGVGPVLLRPGHVSPAQIAEVLGMAPSAPDAAAPQVSGSLKAHYAPRTPLLILAATDLLKAVRAASATGEPVAVVAFAPLDTPPGVDVVVVEPDPQIYAQRLYALLRRLDAGQYARILVQRPPEDARWQAVNDRLGRAAAAFL